MSRHQQSTTERNILADIALKKDSEIQQIKVGDLRLILIELKNLRELIAVKQCNEGVQNKQTASDSASNIVRDNISLQQYKDSQTQASTGSQYHPNYLIPGA